MVAPRHRFLTIAAICVALLGPLLGAVVSASPARAALPSRSQWLADVAHAMAGSQRYVDERAVDSDRLAVNLDIDNTSLATYYDRGQAVRAVLRFARNAEEDGVAVLFNTGRVVGDGRIARARRQLVAAGYPVTRMCGRSSVDEPLADSKQRCRQRFVDEGYTIIANVGNRSTDFTGGDYERAFRLPSYGDRLG